MEKATQGRTRVHNTRLVLRTIYSGGPVSRADVARTTRLTPPTISDVVSDLIGRGLVEEVGLAPSLGGRRAILLSVVDDARQLIGIDLSRRDFRGVLANLRGTIHHRIELPLDGRDGEAALALVFELTDALLAAASKPILGIGIGAPGLVDSAKGILRQSVNLNWRYVPFRELLEERYHLPVYMANDCQLSALAAYTYQDNRQDQMPLVVINVGWGVGAGIVIHGELLHGDPVGAGEIGHVVVEEGGQLCACGNHGCLETVASTRAITSRARAALEANPDSSLHHFVGNPEEITLDTLLMGYQAGNEPIRTVIREAGRALGIAASHLVGVLGSCKILVGGCGDLLGQFLLESMQDELEKRTLPALARATELGVVETGSDMVVLGASALILQRELGLL
ncbi:MAG: ROK family transcriptional regulator [Anaerolineales bacterium]|nr:ROK family transcriptional regulator [Anaerolineales bacterium]